MYSDIAKQHFINPRNVGELGSDAAVGRAGSLTCGAVLRIMLQIDDSQIIADARFRAAGCSLLVAACSLLTGQVKEKTTAEAAALAQSRETIATWLGEPPPGREHCLALAGEALLAAVQCYSDSVRAEWSGEDALICTCFGVSEQTIEREIQAGGLRTIGEVTQACKAGAGCRSCYSLIEDMLDDRWRT